MAYFLWYFGLAYVQVYTVYRYFSKDYHIIIQYMSHQIPPAPLLCRLMLQIFFPWELGFAINSRVLTQCWPTILILKWRKVIWRSEGKLFEEGEGDISTATERDTKIACPKLCGGSSWWIGIGEIQCPSFPHKKKGGSLGTSKFSRRRDENEDWNGCGGVRNQYSTNGTDYINMKWVLHNLKARGRGGQKSFEQKNMQIHMYESTCFCDLHQANLCT